MSIKVREANVHDGKSMAKRLHHCVGRSRSPTGQQVKNPICKRSWNIPMDERQQLLNRTIRGWINYFAIGSMKGKMEKIDEHLRTMLRKVI